MGMFNDNFILARFDEDPELARMLVEEKYNKELSVIKYFSYIIDFPVDIEKIVFASLSNAAMYKEDDLNSKYELVSYRKYGNKDNIIKKEIDKVVREVVVVIYRDFDLDMSFEEFFTFVCDLFSKSDEHLFALQSRKFHYIDGAITNVSDQIYDELNIIMSHLVGINENEVFYEPEEYSFIENMVDRIRDLLGERQIEKASETLVLLQLKCDFDVRMLTAVKRVVCESLERNKVLVSRCITSTYNGPDDTKGKGRSR